MTTFYEDIQAERETENGMYIGLMNAVGSEDILGPQHALTKYFKATLQAAIQATSISWSRLEEINVDAHIDWTNAGLWKNEDVRTQTQERLENGQTPHQIISA